MSPSVQAIGTQHGCFAKLVKKKALGEVLPTCPSLGKQSFPKNLLLQQRGFLRTHDSVYPVVEGVEVLDVRPHFRPRYAVSELTHNENVGRELEK